MQNSGKISQIISAVVDVEFENGEMPAIYNALVCDNNGKKLVSVLVSEGMVGHKFGEFAPTRTFYGHGGDKTVKKS